MARPYGWGDNGQLVDSEAAELQAMASQIIDGVPVRRVVADLTDRGVATVTGGQWAPLTVTRALTSPRMVGKRLVGDTLVDTGAGAVLDEDTWDKVCSILNDPARKRFAPKRPKRMLLTGGLARCGRCGKNLHATGTDYACAARYGGCAGITIKADLLDAEVTERVLVRITDTKWRKGLQRALAHPSGYYAEQVELARQRLVQLAETFGGGGDVDREALEAGRAAAHKAIAEAQRAQQIVDAAGLLPEPSAGQVVSWWTKAPVSTRREVVALVLDHVTVAPKRGRKTTEERLTFTWA